MNFLKPLSIKGKTSFIGDPANSKDSVSWKMYFIFNFTPGPLQEIRLRLSSSFHVLITRLPKISHFS
jgi:hypothetical protein